MNIAATSAKASPPNWDRAAPLRVWTGEKCTPHVACVRLDADEFAKHGWLTFKDPLIYNEWFRWWFEGKMPQVTPGTSYSMERTKTQGWTHRHNDAPVGLVKTLDACWGSPLAATKKVAPAAFVVQNPFDAPKPSPQKSPFDEPRKPLNPFGDKPSWPVPPKPNRA